MLFGSPRPHFLPLSPKVSKEKIIIKKNARRIEYRRALIFTAVKPQLLDFGLEFEHEPPGARLGDVELAITVRPNQARGPRYDLDALGVGHLHGRREVLQLDRRLLSVRDGHLADAHDRADEPCDKRVLGDVLLLVIGNVLRTVEVGIERRHVEGAAVLARDLREEMNCLATLYGERLQMLAVALGNEQHRGLDRNFRRRRLIGFPGREGGGQRARQDGGRDE